MDTSTDRINRRSQIEAKPRVHFVCGRDVLRGPDDWRLGVFWDRNLNAGPFERCYRRWWTAVLRLHLFIDKN